MQTLCLNDGTIVDFRLIRPDDEFLIAEAIRTSSPQTLLHRFFTPLRELPRSELRRLLTLDPSRDYCVVGVIQNPERIICGARYVRSPLPGTAEIAMTVHDDFQGNGIGKFLLRHLIDRADKDGIRLLTAEVMATNSAMLKLLQSTVPNRRSTIHEGVVHLEIDVPAVRSSP